ncbi:MAG: hypothetical protein RI995_1551 [Bacteroidota bacterium]
MKAALKYLISTVLAVALLYWAFSSSHLSWSDILHTLSTANYTWVSVSIFISILAHYFRAVRWNQLLAVMKYHPGTTRTLSAVLIGYFANFIIPRMGEVSRCGSLQKTAEIPFEKSFGTVITERIVDLLCLAVVLGINLLIEFEPLQHYLFPNIHLPGNALLIAAGTLLLLAIFLIYKYKNQFFNLLESKKDTSKIIQLLMGWIDGIKSIFLVKNPALFIFYSAGIWICYYLNAYVLLLAFPESMNLGLGAAVTVLVMGSFGMTMPTQGGIGAYHSLVGSTLVYYGIQKTNATALATFFHGTQMVSILLLGGLSFIITLILPKINSLENK